MAGVINTLGPRQNGRHFAKDIFKRIFVNGVFIFKVRFRSNKSFSVELTNVSNIVLMNLQNILMDYIWSHAILIRGSINLIMDLHK